MTKILPNDCIKTSVKASTWQECIKIAGQLLLDKKTINEKYIESVEQAVHKFGPYMIILPEICFFHGEPNGENVNETSLSLITLENEVNFSEFEGETIKCAFFFAAKDSGSHIDMLGKFASFILENEELTEKLKNNPSKEELVELLKDF